MLDTATKRRIDDCRDILVGKLPDPKAQIEQITIGLIYKFMDDMDKEAVELGGKAKFFSNYSIPDPKDIDKQLVVEFEKYSWDSLFDAKVTATEMLTLYAEAIAGMDKNPNIPQLFRDIFKNAYLPYRDPETLKMFLKTINEFEYSHSEKLGDAFEYLLSVMGSQGDAGQFRTPRHIIDFLVAAVNPGKTDTILDPACGTAGFLISAFKHIMGDGKDAIGNDRDAMGNDRDAINRVSTITPDERKRLINNFVGYDISPDMVRLSLVNLYLHGFSAPHIWEYDTLSSEERWNENFDVILANPPFMSPKGGIRPHKKFSISSNRSEVLFVDYIAEHLNPKGRAGIIVPEGVIFQSGTAYKDLRKMLVDNYLYAVISLPAGVFNPYSGVKTSILLMDKELAKTNDTVLFVKVENDGYGLGAQRNAVKGGELDDAIELLNQFKAGTFSESEIAHIVQKSVIAEKGDHNLNGEGYKISEKNFDNTAYQKLGKICDFKRGPFGGRLKKEIFVESGYAVYEQSHAIYNQFQDFRYFISENKFNEMKGFEVQPNDILMSCSGTMGKVSIVPNGAPKGIINQALLKLTVSKSILPNYLKLLMESESFQYALNKTVMGVAIQNVASVKVLKELEIPLPPLSVQEEIVAEIEGYQKIIDGAKMVVENYKPKIYIDPEWEMLELGDLFSKVTRSVLPIELKSKIVNYIGLENISQGTGELVGDFITNPQDIKSTKTVFERSDVLYGKLRPNLNKVYYSEIEGICSTDIFVLRGNKRVNPKFYSSYFLADNFNQEVLKGIKGAQLPRVGYEHFSKILLPLPRLDIQHQIVARIEKEQALVNANKELIGIFEQKIKDRIGKVWGETAPAPKSAPNPAPKSPKGDLESAAEDGLLAAEPGVEYGEK
jgi:type I restriction enzyme M protein